MVGRFSKLCLFSTCGQIIIDTYLYEHIFTECPKPVNTLTILLGVIGGILIIGIMLLVLWKIIVTMYDKIEYAKFEKELAKAKWEVVMFNCLV